MRLAEKGTLKIQIEFAEKLGAVRALKCITLGTRIVGLIGRGGGKDGYEPQTVADALEYVRLLMAEEAAGG